MCSAAVLLAWPGSQRAETFPGLPAQRLTAPVNGPTGSRSCAHVQATKDLLQKKFATGKNRWFFQKLRCVASIRVLLSFTCLIHFLMTLVARALWRFLFTYTGVLAQRRQAE